jgi:hypothetical protein
MKLQHIAAAILLSAAIVTPLSVFAQDATPAATATATPKAKKEKKAAAKTLPIKGEVKAVDKTAKTFTVGETVLTVSDSTKFTGVTFDTLAVGTKVTGSYTKDGDKNDAVSVKVAADKKK